MSLNVTPSGERTNIGFFGLRNAGKSSLVNAIVGQQLSVVSDVRGTTTDIVQKAMELLPLGPVVIVDTPGIDDEGALGELRVQKTREALRRCDIAVLVSQAGTKLQPAELELLELFRERHLPFVVARTKSDLLSADCTDCGLVGVEQKKQLLVSALDGTNINEFKEFLAHSVQTEAQEHHLLDDLISEGDVVVLVMPIDASAPKGRLILPQQMVTRAVIDQHAIALSCQPQELKTTLEHIVTPRLVICDSQVFGMVSSIVPREMMLTSFSILMARYRGDLSLLVEGANKLSQLSDESRVLISEGCTHHRQCEDIGTVKLPAWIRAHCGAFPHFEFSSGRDFPEDVESFDVIVHCGGCMLNPKEMGYRLQTAAAARVPIVNYGVAIACMHGILERSLEPLSVLQ